MSTATPSTASATKNGVFFLIGAKPGDAEYAEHIRSALDALEQISQEDPDFKYRHVGSAQDGARKGDWKSAFYEFAKKCPDDITLLVSSPAKYWGDNHTVYLVPDDWCRSTTWSLLDSYKRIISDDGRNTERRLDTVFFTSGGYCPPSHVDNLPSDSRLLSFDTDKIDTGSRFIADIVREAAKTKMAAKDFATAASCVEHSAGYMRPTYQLLWREGFDIKGFVESCSITGQGDGPAVQEERGPRGEAM